MLPINYIKKSTAVLWTTSSTYSYMETFFQLWARGQMTFLPISLMWQFSDLKWHYTVGENRAKIGKSERCLLKRHLTFLFFLKLQKVTFQMYLTCSVLMHFKIDMFGTRVRKLLELNMPPVTHCGTQQRLPTHHYNVINARSVYPWPES